METHHITEKRLVEGSMWKISQMPSIEPTKTVHRVYINAWSSEIPCGIRYVAGLAYKYKLYKAANSVYEYSGVLRIAVK